MATVDYTDALDAGWRIFPLHSIISTSDGKRCGCGDLECEAIGKHPRASNWQHTQDWDETQLEYLEDHEGFFFGNQLLDGYGIVTNTSELLVVDVDGRNGGFDSAKSLQVYRDQCGYIVRTGSGNGEHWYFKVPSGYIGKQFITNLITHKGIDFKSSGYVVGAYSEHASGLRYEAIKGSPGTVTEAPAELLQMLERKEKSFHLGDYSVDEDELSAMLFAIPNTDATTYEEWLHIGMALHNATGGADNGLDLWIKWSRQSNPSECISTMGDKWHGFGKSANPVTAATIAAKARENGYSAPVEFVDDTQWNDDDVVDATAVDNEFNMLSPPGIVGELADWINSRCAFPREKLAVAAALQIVSNAAGLNYLVAGQRTSLNLITMAIAGSRTGKGAIKTCIDEAHFILGISPACHGKFKSSQELVKNAIDHQMIVYVYDEFGKQLEKVSGAGKSGAHYLEDLLPELMAIYSVPTGMHGLSGDLKREIIEKCDKEIAREIKKLGIDDDENPLDFIKDDPSGALASAFKRRKDAEVGLIEPYLTFFGMSEPNSFNVAVEKDPWLLTGGFLGRAIIVEEEETVPEKKKSGQYNHNKMPEYLAGRLCAMFTNGNADSGSRGRIERKTDWKYINFSKCGSAFFEKIGAYWREKAIMERDSGSSLESQALGAEEIAIKVAGILAAETKVITEVEASWAHELVKMVTLNKIERAKSNEKLKSTVATEKGDGLLSAIMRHMEQLGDGSYTTAGRARQAAGRSKVTLENTVAALDHLAAQEKVLISSFTAKNGKQVTHYYKK